jgi:hypothetical protein
MMSKTNITRESSRSTREITLIIVIILVFVLLAIGTWKWFDYKIARLQYGSDASSVITSKSTDASYETL